jgi:MoaA/NifB/PqqE/SkfB family radical SAM enzyme
MCRIWQKQVQDELCLDEIEMLFSKANHFSWINLTGGELFQRPDIHDVLIRIIRHSPYLYLLNFPTNGFQTDDIAAAVDIILKKTNLPRLIVSVSLDGEPDLHDRIRGVSGSWRNAVQTFRKLRSTSSRRFSVYFGHTIQSANLGMFDEMLEACRRVLGNITIEDFHINIAHTSGHYYNNADAGALPDHKETLHEITRISTMRKFKHLDPIGFVERRYQQRIKNYLANGRVELCCQALAGSCFINPSGVIYPCSTFDVPIGALRDHGMDFYRVWHSVNRHHARDSIRRNNCPGCWTPCEAYQTILANLVKK